MLHMLANPTSDILSCRVERQHIVEMLVVEPVVNLLLDMREVYHHTVGVQHFGTTIDGNNPIVTVKIFTLAAI